MTYTTRKPVSPGEILIEEFLKPLGMTQQDLADLMGTHNHAVYDICDNKRPIDVDIAESLSEAFGNTAEFWVNIQSRTEGN